MTVVIGDGVVELTAELRGLRQAIEKQTEAALKTVEKDFEKSGEKSGKGFGKAATVAIGAALTVGAVAAIAGMMNALEQEASSADLAASIGLSPAESAQAGKIAGELYADNFGGSFEEINSALESVLQTGLTALDAPQAEIEALTGQALTLADVFEVDLAEAVATVGILIRNGLVTNGQEGLDLLTALFQSAAPTLREPIIEALSEYSVFFAQLGIEGDNAVAALISASAGGEIALDKLGDGLKELTVLAINGSDRTSDALKSIGLSADDIGPAIAAGGKDAQAALDQIISGLVALEDKQVQATAGAALFGVPFEDLGQNAIPTLVSLRQGLDDVAGSAQEVVDTIGDTKAAKIETFKRQIEQNVTNVMSEAVDIVLKLPGPLQTAIGTMVGLAPVLGPLAAIIGPLIPLLFGQATATAAAGTASAAAAPGFFAAAAGLAATALPFIVIGAAVVGLGFLIFHFRDEIGDVFKAIGRFLKDFIGGVVDFVREWGILLLGPIGFVIKFKDEIYNVLQNIAGIFRSAFDGFVQIVRDGVAFIVDKFLGLAEGILKAADRAFGWVPFVGDKLSAAADGFEKFRDDVNASLRGIEDKTINVTIQAIGGVPAGTYVGGMSEGGLVGGTGTKDTVIAALTPGEYVLTRDEVAALRGQGARIPGLVNSPSSTITTNVYGVGVNEVGDVVARKVSMQLGLRAAI